MSLTTRRSFLGSILAAGMAPAIVKAEILMPVRKIIVPEWGIGIADELQPYQREINRLLVDMIRYGVIKTGGQIHYVGQEFHTFKPLKGRA